MPILLLGGITAALSWFLAQLAFGIEGALFAPIAAVWTLGQTIDERPRRALGVALGVALGLGVADLFVALIGVGIWQLAIVIIVARAAAILADGTVLAINQATVSAILVITLHSEHVFPGARFLDALIGSAVALGATWSLNALRPPSRTRRPQQNC